MTATIPGVRIEDVKVGERARKDYGDLDQLKASIVEHGLLQPIVLLPDNYLLCGGRRLAACRDLGWEAIPFVQSATQTDAASRLKAERDENTCRKDMTVSELVALGRQLEDLERPKALERQGTRTDRTSSSREEEVRGRATDAVVGEALGLSSTTYWRAKKVVDTAQDEGEDPEVRKAATTAMALMDAGKITINKAATLVSEAQAEAVAASTADHGSRLSLEARLAQIQDLAPRGLTSGQIADELGLSEGYVRDKARDNHIEIVADKVMNRTHRTRIDSNHIVQETVTTLQGLASSAALVSFGDLDASQTANWAASLTESIRTLTQMKNKIKEMTQ